MSLTANQLRRIFKDSRYSKIVTIDDSTYGLNSKAVLKLNKTLKKMPGNRESRIKTCVPIGLHEYITLKQPFL